MKTESVYPGRWEEHTRDEVLVPVDDCIRWRDHGRTKRSFGWMESGAIPSEPGDGCVIISKKTSAPCYRAWSATVSYAPFGLFMLILSQQVQQRFPVVWATGFPHDRQDRLSQPSLSGWVESPLERDIRRR